ncbi:MAG: SPOR domain-containing protein [Deltaproteobacteria bacterium]|nr:SPOR domain-containing protein [Deltaproteobacteria bacterium]
MAERRGTGLSFGQLITLTFGFLLASVVIFVFGLWVGRDLAEQQALRQRDPAKIPLSAPPPTAVPVAAGLAAAPAPTFPMVRPAVPTAVPIPATATARSLPSATWTAIPRATATRTKAVAAASPTAGSGSWTVQAYATNDTVRAVMVARTLRAKGYDASTATKQIGGVTWYTVRVGRFRDRATAKAMETKLREEEGLEAASAVSQ